MPPQSQQNSASAQIHSITGSGNNDTAPDKGVTLRRTGEAVSAEEGNSGSEFAEDNEDDDEEEEEEEDDEEEEEEMDTDEVEEKTGFDENFLAQLMAMDPLFSGKPVLSDSSQSQQMQGAQSQAAFPAMPRPDQATDVTQYGTPFPNMPAYASAASTPSNEFYDGAINFLTEVLGSSNPSMWGDVSRAQPTNTGEPTMGQSPAILAPSPAPTEAQFKNLQPLISNLIARLKGQPVEETGHMPQVLEEDLVVLLQSLMAQRQAQVEKKAQQQKETQSQSAKPASSSNQSGLAYSYGGARQQQQPTGFSIVDFDFGDDDDDPDFVPGNINLNFGNSQEFAEALASVTHASDQNLSQREGKENEANDKVWQQMFDSLGNTAGAESAQQASPNTAARRTRAASRNVANEALQNEAKLAEAMRTSPTFSATQEESIDGTESMTKDEGESLDGASFKGRKRKIYSAEEALERRREANRECARRQRARKKQETEQIRQELERIQAMHAEGKAPSDSIIDVTQALVGRRKRGRPLGSKNRRTIEEMERYAIQAVEETEVVDLRADNRMLRAEMHRLQEENAKLRARALRHEEMFEQLGRGDLIKRPLHGSDGASSGGESLRLSDVSEDERELDRHTRRFRDPASEFLAFNPFRRAFRPSEQEGRNTRSRPSEQADRDDARSGQGDRAVSASALKRLAASLQQDQPTSRNVMHHETRNGGGSSSHRRHDSPSQADSLKDLLRAAAQEMDSFGYPR